MVPGFAERERRFAEMQRRDWLTDASHGIQNQVNFPNCWYTSLRRRNHVIEILRRPLLFAIALGHRLQTRRPETMQPIPEQG